MSQEACAQTATRHAGRSKRVVTIGVPARNEAATIAQTIRSLLAQELAGCLEIEVIVCANACTDRTLDRVEEITIEDPRVRAIEMPTPGKPHAMNLIRTAATGDILFFCDADARPGQGAVQQIVQQLEDRPDLVAVGATMIPDYPKRPNWVEILGGVGRVTHEQVNICGAFFACRKELLPAFPPGVLNEDTWLSYVLGRDRYAIAPNVRVRQRVPHRLQDLLSQIRRWDAARIQLYQWGVAELPNPLTRFLARLKRLRALSLREMAILPALLPIALWARVSANAALRKGEFRRGWEPPTRSQ
jgi:glycosyltransferase involved in cell wall biosynthesis